MAVFARDLGMPETPRLTPDGSGWLLVETAPDRGCVSRLDLAGSNRRVIAHLGRPNGCIMDHNGVIWVAESQNPPSLIRIPPGGEPEVFVREVDGEPFLFPNDLCLADGPVLYLTDSGLLFEEWVMNGAVRADWATAPIDGRIYRIDLVTKEVTVLDRGLAFTNGIALGPDGSIYANEMNTGMIYRYEIEDGRPGSQRQRFGNVLDPDWRGEAYRGPDGMAFDANGYLYCAVYGQGDVTVLDPSGEVVRRISTAGKFPTNVAFGPNDERRLYVTEMERGQIEVFEVETGGLPLRYGEQVTDR